MSVDIMSEADTKFIADNMLTADDFDLSASLDISTLARLSQELQFYKQSLPGSGEDPSFRSLSEFFGNEELLWEKPDNGQEFEEITCDISYNMDCDREIKVELTSPNPSPGSTTSGYSSQGSWNEECSVTEIEVPESEFSESPPDSPPNVTSPAQPLIMPTVCLPPLTVPVQTVIVGQEQLTPAPKSTVPLPKAKPGVREIQPKAVKRKLQLCSANGAAQPLILTQEEFSQLTASSVGLQQPPIIISPSLSQAQPVEANRRPSLPTLNIKSDMIQAPTDTQVKALKRQQRMIRNRESAFLSRKKRREYVQNLEQHLNDLNVEKGRLLAENCQLKEKIKNLEIENRKLKTIFPSSNFKKTTTCLMAVLFMLALNITPFSGLLLGRDIVQKSPVSSVNRYGRNLLWTPELQDPENLPIRLEDDLAQNLQNFKQPSFKNLSSCPTFVNKTEAIRLEKELRGWAMRVEKQKQKPSMQKLRKKLLVPMPRLHNLLQGKTHLNVGQKDLEVYSAPRTMYEDLFDALDRRDDTFYFVSFSGDHLLLPASAHNRTQRPKMALVMPAMTLNETTKENQVTMMQIDCEVMNMHLVDVKETAIPLHLRQKLTHTTHSQASSRNTTSTSSGNMERNARQRSKS